MSQEKPKTVYLKDYRPADFIIETVHLHFDLHEDVTHVKSILKMKRNPEANTPVAPLVLDGEAMTLQKAFIDGQPLSADQYQVDDISLTIPQVPEAFTLELEVDIKPQENTTLSGLYKSRTNFCTQCESHGFRRITYYLDRPDVMARFTTAISADKTKYPFLLSNGNLIEKKELADNRHWMCWQDPSLKPSYLFALVAGDFDVLEDSFVTTSGRKVDLCLYLEKGFADQGAYALQALQRAMRWDEEKFGREYDLDIYMVVAVSDFNMGAMENKGLNIFNTKYILARPETATDADYTAIEAVIGHEYFHNWTGNRITCRDWFQITLKEGLTVFRDQSFTEDMTSEGVARIDVVNVVRNLQFPEDAGPTAHPIRPDSYIEVNNFYTLTVYRKGSEVIRMIQTLIGKDKFRQGMDLYFSRHDGQAVTTEDFVKAMEDAAPKDLTQFKRWYSQAGTPVLDVTGDYDADGKTFTLTVKQSCPATPGQDKKEPFHLPLKMGLVGIDCSDIILQLEGENEGVLGSRVLEIKEPVEVFKFINVDNKPVPSLLRDFSAPVKLNYPYTDDELLWLLQCDSNPFSRWEAAQAFNSRLIFKLVESYQAGESLEMDARLVDAYARILQDEHQDRQFVARLLQLPAENYLIQQMMPVADVDAIHAARNFVKKELAIALADEWQRVYDQNQLSDYEYTMEDVGQRALKNLCLAYLTETEDAQYYELAHRQFIESNNMTDVMGALAALNNHDCSLRDQALDAFYEQWKEQALVVNKWLGLQAMADVPFTLQRVKQCLHHEGFDIKNPNKVYALIVAFGGNTVAFHQQDGAGYEFVADQVLAIDPNNPQVAARVITPLTRWARYDETRQALMKAQLERILEADGLSKDVYELASKSLVG